MARTRDIKKKSILIKKIDAAGLTCEDISKKLGFSTKSTISRALVDPGRTTIETYLKIAEIVGVDKAVAVKEWKAYKIKRLKWQSENTKVEWRKRKFKEQQKEIKKMKVE